jgi:hypothetical protein
MLDVHPAHHAASTWRDFFIHIATIVLGLLIAVGLEQTVEAIHHSHQRHQLQEDLHAESVRVHTVLQGNLRLFAAERIWLLALRKDVDTMRASNGRIKLPYRPRPTSDPNDPTQPLPRLTWPPDGVWQAAKASALVSLLPRWQAEIYSGVSRQQDLYGAVANAWIAEQTNLIAFETRFDDAGPSSTPDLARMTPEQLDQYSAMLTRNLALRDTIVNRSKIFDAADLAILDGATSRDDVAKRIDQQKVNLER